MYLHSVEIENFRSIEKDSLDNCGNFNVLIGKNNSGKSNVLSAIEAFFSCVKGGQVITLDPAIGRKIDFFERAVARPIRLRISFYLGSEERLQLINDIVAESPQMKNAAESFPESLILVATLSVKSSPKRFAYITSLSLRGKDDAFSETFIFSANDKAAEELFKAADEARRIRTDQQTIENLMARVDADDYQRYVNRERPGRGLYYGGLEGNRMFQSLVEGTSSYSELLEKVASIKEELKAELNLILKAPLQNKVITFAGEESNIPKYVQKLLTEMASLKVYYVRERRKDIGKEEAKQILDLKVQRGGTEKLADIQRNVSDLLGVHIDAFQGSRNERGETVAELDVDNFLVEVNGSGVREALRLILDVEFEQPKVLLVEEPEVHLHPALETSMMRYLKRISAKVQVFLTTHSTNFLDTAEMRNVYLISKTTSTKIQQLDLEAAESQIPVELGIRLSSLFMYDRLVFVEGPSDEAVLREWAISLKVNFSQANVGFVAMGGVRNFTHYAAESTISFLSKRQVRIWFLIDRDERDEADIESLQRLFSGQTEVLVLNKREIENYLIVPRAIIEFIRLKKRISGENDSFNVSEGEISAAVQECADELKEFALNKRVARLICRPVYPRQDRIFDNGTNGSFVKKVSDELNSLKDEIENSRAELEKVYEEQSTDIESSWSVHKLSLVPGDMLLDLVCKRYGVRFKKERDSARLASLLKVEEIDLEIKEVLRKLAEVM